MTIGAAAGIEWLPAPPAGRAAAAPGRRRRRPTNLASCSATASRPGARPFTSCLLYALMAAGPLMRVVLVAYTIARAVAFQQLR